MSIIRRSKRNTTFVQIDKTPLQDNTISWKAKGLLAYLLSLPDDWQIYTSELINHSTDGKDSTRSGMTELIEAGYIKRKQQKIDGKFAGYVYTVYEIPEPEKPQRKNRSGYSVNGKSVNGKPATTNKDNTNKEITNKERQITNSDELEVVSPSNGLSVERDAEKEKSCAKKEKVRLAQDAIEFLNELAGREFASNPKGEGRANGQKNIDKVVKLLNQKYSLDDIKLVIEYKTFEWKGNERMEKYLQPSTVFGNKFSEYLQNAEMARDNPKFRQSIQKAKRAERKGVDPSLPQDIIENIKNF